MDWLSNGVMFGWYASILVAIGATGAVRVMASSHGPGSTGWSTRALRQARLIMPLVLLALVGRLWLQTWQAFGSDQPLTLAHAVVIITETPWGTGWAWQTAAGLAAWITIAMASPQRWGLLLLAAAALGGTVGFTGHAAGADAYVSMVIAAHGLHVLAAGLWLGTLAMILAITRPDGAPAEPDTREQLARVIDRFSPQAVVSVTVLATSGVVAAWQHVGNLQSLFTPYGFVLVAKVVAFGAAGLCGLYNWRVVRPSLAVHPDGAAHLRSIASLELICGFCALALTSILTSMPMPAHE
jgi:putative copper resistance protein D